MSNNGTKITRRAPVKIVPRTINGTVIDVNGIDAVAWKAYPGKVGGHIFALMILFKSGKDVELPDSKDARDLYEDLAGEPFNPKKVLLIAQHPGNRGTERGLDDS